MPGVSHLFHQFFSCFQGSVFGHELIHHFDTGNLKHLDVDIADNETIHKLDLQVINLIDSSHI